MDAPCKLISRPTCSLRISRRAVSTRPHHNRSHPRMIASRHARVGLRPLLASAATFIPRRWRERESFDEPIGEPGEILGHGGDGLA